MEGSCKSWGQRGRGSVPQAAGHGQEPGLSKSGVGPGMPWPLRLLGGERTGRVGQSGGGEEGGTG